MANEEQISVEMAELLKTIANPIRLQILCCILEKKKNVSELLEKINIAQSPLSQHLAILKKNKIIKSEKHGKYIFYSIKDEKTKKILGFLGKICQINNS
jgi:DNA-binding transcriptional ArsR family regulator